MGRARQRRTWGEPVYSVDIATDPIWADFREVALQHGFRSCWSTPIRDANAAIIGTFAILHRTMGMPTHEEVEAIELITGHVADAIMWFRGPEFIVRPDRHRCGAPKLKLVASNKEPCDPAARLAALAEKLQSKGADLRGYADRAEFEADAQVLRDAAELSRKLSASILSQIELISPKKPVR